MSVVHILALKCLVSRVSVVVLKRLPVMVSNRAILQLQTAGLNLDQTRPYRDKASIKARVSLGLSGLKPSLSRSKSYSTVGSNPTI
jgi:hypothetical protein